MMRGYDTSVLVTRSALQMPTMSAGTLHQSGQLGKPLFMPAPKKHPVFYRPELDALRFLAFTMVFIVHAPVPKQHVLQVFHYSMCAGLCIFFLLSAYLITELMLREMERTRTIHIKAFFIRRILRIWPLYFLAITLAFLLGQYVPDWHIPWTALPFLLLLGGNFFVAHFGWQLGVISPLWSLSVEEQFYLIIPLVVKLGGARALKLLSCITIGIAYLSLIDKAHQHATSNPGVWITNLVQFQFFAAGTLLAIALHKRTWRASWPLRALFFFGGFAGLFLAERQFGVFSGAILSAAPLCLAYVVMLASCIGIFLSVLGVEVKLPRFLIYLGRISFGLYVFHSFVLAWAYHPGRWGLPANVNAAAILRIDLMSFAITIVLATISFELFEKRILRFKEKFALVKSGAEVSSGGAPATQ